MSDEKKVKKKKLNPIAVTGAVILALAVAVYSIFGDRKQYDIIGTWVVDTNEVESGFQCGKHGIAASIKNSTKQYNTWELRKGKLIMKGKLFSEGRVNDFNDTLLILNLNSEKLTVKQDDKTTRYHKIR
ncbi:MAG: hypothetical protein IIY87_06555 [Bacteroidales bacterium]|nr:hypothetical protein [Bacteroidales bacterium]